MGEPNEIELVIYGTLDRHSFLTITKNEIGQEIVQAESTAYTRRGVRITTRVRKVIEGGDPYCKIATKIRKPQIKGSSVSKAIEVECPVTTHEFDELYQNSDTIHHKTRYTIELDHNLKAEIDIYLISGSKNRDSFVKVDIEGATDKDYPKVIELLRSKGIRFSQVLNVPGTQDPRIQQTISLYMGNRWNFYKG